MFHNIKLYLFGIVAFVMSATSSFGVTITYNLNGGHLPGNNDPVYQIETSANTVVPANPIKDNYIFAGWCDSEHYSKVNNQDTCSTDRVGLETITNGNASKTLVHWTMPDNPTTNTTYVAMWEQDKFQIDIAGIDVNDDVNRYYDINISALGNFWIDWGDGNIEYIHRETAGNISQNTYSHTYAQDGNYKIHMGGKATRYLGYTTVAFCSNHTRGTSMNEGLELSISYENDHKVTGISGSLGAIFPTLSDNTENLSDSVANLGNGDLLTFQPRFSDSFFGCADLVGSLPENLFDGIYGRPANRMFAQTFFGCTGLTGSIPPHFFGNLSGRPAPNMFGATFARCSGLTGTSEPDPNNPGMNYAIPPTLFSGISGAPAQGMFAWTFEGCTGLTGTIPSGLFGNLTGAPANGMFDLTFYDCSGLTGPIPDNLFGNLTGAPAEQMFRETFYGCRSLGTKDRRSTYYIPRNLFGNITKPDSNNLAETTAPDQMNGMFENTALLTSCQNAQDGATAQYITGFEEYFDGRVSCMNPNGIKCSSGKKLVGTSCSVCDVNEDCPEQFYDCPSGYAPSPTYDACVQYYTIHYNNLDNGGGPNGGNIGELSNGTPVAYYHYNNNIYYRNVDEYDWHQYTGALTIPSPVQKYGCGGDYVINECWTADFGGWYENADFTGGSIDTLTLSSDSTGDITLYARFGKMCDVGHYARALDNQWLGCYRCSANYYCPGDNGNPKTYYYSDLSSVVIDDGINYPTNLVAGIYKCDSATPYSYTGAEAASKCSVCPPVMNFGNEMGVYNLEGGWFDLNGDNLPSADECIDMIYTATDMKEVQTCMMKALCTNAPAQASAMDIPCEQLALATCDYASAGLAYMTCRYNENTFGYQNMDLYTDCSSVVNVCNDTDMLGLLPAMAGNVDSADLFPVELTKKRYNTSNLSGVNWNNYFNQSLMTVVAQVVSNGTSAPEAIGTLTAYNTCSGSDCLTEEVTIMGAPMCLIEVKPTYALPVKGSNGSVY